MTANWLFMRWTDLSNKKLGYQKKRLVELYYRKNWPVDHFRGDFVLSIWLVDIDDGSLPAPVEGDVRSSFSFAGQDSGLTLVRSRLGDRRGGVDFWFVYQNIWLIVFQFPIRNWFMSLNEERMNTFSSIYQMCLCF